MQLSAVRVLLSLENRFLGEARERLAVFSIDGGWGQGLQFANNLSVY